MAEPPPAPGRIFISYRREETAYPAGWLFDRLADEFGPGQIFKDVDSIELGDDFVEVISTAVGSCDVLLALIGDEWVTITDAHGQRRLDDPDDFVRLEIEAALARKVRVIPILVDGARMPRADELPSSLATLARRQALELSPSRFDFDTSRLLKVLDKTLAEVRTADAGAPLERVGFKAPDPSATETQKAPERGDQSRLTPADSIPPVVAATPGEPSDVSESDSQRRPVFTRARIRAAIGVAVVIIALVIVVIVANSPDTSQDDSSGRASSVIFQDDFSDRASGWDDVGEQPIGGHYSNGAYRIYADADAGEDGEFAWAAKPRKTENMFPTAPLSLSIEVDARKIAGGSRPRDGYGILCRAEGNQKDYSFILGNEQVIIGKSTPDVDFKTLDSAVIPAAAPNATNHLQAVCTSIEGESAVHLEFSVNGNVVATATDRDDPHLIGTLGLFVFTVDTLEVEFDNFVATEL
jgi:hypothetical protein